MSHSMPHSTSIPGSVFSGPPESPANAPGTAGLPSSPFAIATRFEWSVIAMYAQPPAFAASAISKNRRHVPSGRRRVHVEIP